jgi:hypothetical protein
MRIVTALPLVLVLATSCRSRSSRDTATAAPPPPVVEPSVDAPPPVDAGSRVERMEEAAMLYDRMDLEGAVAVAATVLAEEPDNVRMLRIVVSARCLMGQAEPAREHWKRLPPADQKQMTARCARFKITLP